MDLLREILDKVSPGSVCKECKEGECHLTLDGLGSTKYVLIGMDGPWAPASQTETRCDFLFFGRIPDSGEFWVSPIELTASVHKSSTRVLEQLRAGADLAADLLPLDQDVSFAPVAAGPFGKFRRREFRSGQNRISFRNNLVFPAAVACGSELLDALVAIRGG